MLHPVLPYVTCLYAESAFRLLLRALFDYLIKSKRSKIQYLADRKSQIIEDVKENEKFKVAKEIIEKYGNKEDLEFLDSTAKKEVKGKEIKEEPPSDDEGKCYEPFWTLSLKA